MKLVILENDFKREIKRSNGNIVYYEIVSFNEGDIKKLDKEMFLKVVKKYFEKRSKNL